MRHWAFIGVAAITTAALGQPTATTIPFRAGALSADGRVAVGGGNAQTGGATRWTRETGVVLLGLPDGFQMVEATGVSGDGSVIVGTASNPGGAAAAWKWTEATGFTLLTLPGTSTQRATCVSRDGRVIGGVATPGGGFYAAAV